MAVATLAMLYKCACLLGCLVLGTWVELSPGKYVLRIGRIEMHHNGGVDQPRTS